MWPFDPATAAAPARVRRIVNADFLWGRAPFYSPARVPYSARMRSDSLVSMHFPQVSALQASEANGMPSKEMSAKWKVIYRKHFHWFKAFVPKKMFSCANTNNVKLNSRLTGVLKLFCCETWFTQKLCKHFTEQNACSWAKLNSPAFLSAVFCPNCSQSAPPVNKRSSRDMRRRVCRLSQRFISMGERPNISGLTSALFLFNYHCFIASTLHLWSARLRILPWLSVQAIAVFSRNMTN